MNPGDLLFSLPTINDGICSRRKTTSLDGTLVIDEDDWRQVEFISEQLIKNASSEILSVRNIQQNKRKGVGFTEVHVRKLIEKPLQWSIPYSTLKQSVDIAREFSGLGFHEPMAIAELGFAFETKDHLRFYGELNRAGGIECLCLVDPEGFGESCRKMMSTFSLIFVNWCRAEIVQN